MGGKISAFDIAKQNHQPGNPQKTVLITGTSSGIGLSTALALVGTGWKVIAVVRNPDKMNQVIQNSKWEKASEIQVNQIYYGGNVLLSIPD
jgi:NADP-dependent 3-hydroxy acid dehydrogenase YdfG